MSDNLTDAFNTLKKMVDSGNIPSEMQDLINNINNKNGDSNKTLNDIEETLLIISGETWEMINNVSSMLKGNNNSNSSSNNNLNLDAETIMKMSSVINAMNQKNNPGSNLLNSLKPYLRDSRKSKVDQYANLLNLTKLAEVMKNDKKENQNNA